MLEQISKIWVDLTHRMQTRLKWMGYALTAGALVYLVILLIVSGAKFRAIPLQDFWQASVIALLLYLVSLILQFFIWTRIISFHHQVDLRDVVIYARVILLRRLPGGVWHWVGRTTMYTEIAQLPGKTVMLANFLEWALLVLVAIMIFISGLEAIHPWARGGLLALVLGLCTWLVWAWQPHGRRRIFRLGEGILWTALYGVTWILGGSIVLILAQSAESTSLTWLQAIWVWSVAGGVSFLIVFIPAGLGIREITITWLLQPYLSIAGALMVAIAIRFIFILSDVLWGGLGWRISSWVLSRRKECTTYPSNQK